MVTRVLTIDCVHVWQEISGYLENEIDPELRARMDAHFKECKHCAAVLDGARNVVQLVGDGKAFDVPQDFRRKLYGKLEREWKG